MSTTRCANYPIAAQYLERTSPRAFSSEAVTREEIEQVIEAARWAPSASNKQPWHFAYALRGDAHWAAFSTIPNEFNRRWCLEAGALVVLLSDKDSSRWHSFDAGCAWGFMALQAHQMGLATHAMGGFEVEAAKQALQLPDNWAVEALIAVGRRGDAASLPEDLRSREVASPRKPLDEILSAGVPKLPVPQAA